MKYLLGLVVFIGALGLVGNIDYSDELAYQKYHCQMVLMYNQTENGVAGYPPRDEQELEFCNDLINAQQ